MEVVFYKVKYFGFDGSFEFLLVSKNMMGIIFYFLWCNGM